MKKLLVMLIALGFFTMGCENDSDNLKLDTQNDDADNSALRTAVAPTNVGTYLYSKYGVNLNNSYNAGDKTDWKKFWTYNSDLTTALNLLEDNVTNFKIYRVGFSKSMANDDADLNEWAAALQVMADHGERMIICYWPLDGDYTDATADAMIWQNVVNKIAEKGLLSYVEGWELSNEPHSGNDLAGYYTNVYNGVSNWHEKKIILDGGGYAKAVSKQLYDGTSTISNRLWAVHCYAHYVGGSGDPGYKTPVQWRDDFINAYNEQYKYINGNFIVTEMGVSDDYVDNPTTNEEGRKRGFIAANEIYFGGTTTVFWYSGYNGGKIGLISTSNGAVRTNSVNALMRVFY